MTPDHKPRFPWLTRRNLAPHAFIAVYLLSALVQRHYGQMLAGEQELPPSVQVWSDTKAVVPTLTGKVVLTGIGTEWTTSTPVFMRSSRRDAWIIYDNYRTAPLVLPSKKSLNHS